MEMHKIVFITKCICGILRYEVRTPKSQNAENVPAQVMIILETEREAQESSLYLDIWICFRKQIFVYPIFWSPESSSHLLRASDSRNELNEIFQTLLSRSCLRIMT